MTALGTNIPLYDLHVHLRGGMTVEKAVARQEESGIMRGVLRNIGTGWPIETDEQLAEFLDGVAGFPVLVGLQVNDRDWHLKHSPELLGRLDFVLADTMIMAMPDDDAPPTKLWMPELYTIDDPEAWMRRYMQHNLRILAEPISIFANPTYLPEAVKHLYDELWTDQRMAEIIQRAVAEGIALEIQATSEYPHDRFIGMAKDMGAVFSLGTNNFDDIPIDMKRCHDVVARFGLRAGDLYRPSRGPLGRGKALS